MEWKELTDNCQAIVSSRDEKYQKYHKNDKNFVSQLNPLMQTFKLHHKPPSHDQISGRIGWHSNPAEPLTRNPISRTI